MAELDPPVSLPTASQEAGSELRRSERREPQARAVVPLGRVLGVACLVPILAMIVLGASRFSEVRDLAVGAAPGAASAALDDQELPSLWAPVEEHALFSETRAAAGELDPGLPLLRVVETRMMTVTAYCPCQKCCGKNARGITASGRPVSYNAGRFVAADTSILPFGTLVRVPEYHGELPVEVIDRGGAIKGNKLDVYFPTHAEARQWGRRILPVQIVEPVELGAVDREAISDQ